MFADVDRSVLFAQRGEARPQNTNFPNSGGKASGVCYVLAELISPDVGVGNSFEREKRSADRRFRRPIERRWVLKTIKPSRCFSCV